MDDERRERVLTGLRQMVSVSGQAVVQVRDVAPDWSFSYTIGNAERGLPELLLIGNSDLDLHAPALNDLSERMRASGRALSEGLCDIGWNYPFRLRKAGAAAGDYTLLVSDVLGVTSYDVLQVLLCDLDGRFAGEAGCDPLYDVPLI